MRPWGPEDRISNAAIACWQQELDEAGIAETMIEAELFFHDDEAAQTAAIDDLRAAAQELGGALVMQSLITPIHYHAALLRIPAAGVRQIMEKMFERHETIEVRENFLRNELREANEIKAVADAKLAEAQEQAVRASDNVHWLILNILNIEAEKLGASILESKISLARPKGK